MPKFTVLAKFDIEAENVEDAACHVERYVAIVDDRAGHINPNTMPVVSFTTVAVRPSEWID